MQRGDLEAGVEHFKQAVRLNPKEYLAWLNLGATYRKLGKTQDAIQVYLECQSLDPYSPVAHFYLGELYHQSRDGSNAIRQTEIALELLTSQYGPDFEKTLEARARLRQYMEENKMSLE